MRPGAPSVMVSGQPMMPMWPAGSWDMQTVVCKSIRITRKLDLLYLNSSKVVCLSQLASFMTMNVLMP